MKRIILAFGLISSARADTVIFGSLISMVTSPTNSAVLQTNTVSIPVGKILISNGGLTVTGAFTGNLQFSVDRTNYLNIGTPYSPAATNATTDTIQPQIVSFPIYFRLSASTNGANTAIPSIGASYQSP